MNIPRSEFPRPDFERKIWLNLNGSWDFCFDDKDQGIAERWFNPNFTNAFTLSIMVPFCFQSKNSGIRDESDHEILWYRRKFDLNKDFDNKRTILHFGAVDYQTDVWLNGAHVGFHKGGNVSFAMEISPFVKKSGNVLVVRVVDRNDLSQPRGKQYWKDGRDRCWYTRTSGIWQTVWLEAVGEYYIENFFISPDIDASRVSIEVELDSTPIDGEFEAAVSFSDKKVVTVSQTISSRIFTLSIDLKQMDGVDDIHLWSPSNPQLYQISFSLHADGEIQDEVKSYFGMRKISVRNGMILLNNRPLYQRLVLDQGYWPDSLLTPPSDEAIVHDIELAKQLGFNGARKHQKVEDPRYYYWADRLGFLVWGEMPSAYEFSSDEAENLVIEFIEFIKRDRNHPSIITWVPLNESWGVRNIVANSEQQALSRLLAEIAHTFDGTRLVSSNDGWEQTRTDICGIHFYAVDGDSLSKIFANKEQLMSAAASDRMIYAEGYQYRGEPVLLTEFGGIAFKNEKTGSWGYHHPANSEEEFLKRFGSLFEAVRNIGYLSGYCYTQLYDVEQEVNGLANADRKLKVSLDKIRDIIVKEAEK